MPATNDIICPGADFVSRVYVMKERNRVYSHNFPATKAIDTQFAMNISDAYSDMRHMPNDLLVSFAYQMLVKEITLQAKYMAMYKIKLELYKGSGEPYTNSKEMIEDCNNSHLYILPTMTGYGNDNTFDSTNPMLAESIMKDCNGEILLVNDLFRAVHDYLGHAVEGHQFGPVGEENAWRTHMKLFSYYAGWALTTETRGQNSWVNYGPHMRNGDGKLLTKENAGWLLPSERPFAPQKIGLLPHWAMKMYK